MFEADKADCMSCVTRCLTERQISPCVTSLTEKYTVLDYARFGKEKGIANTKELVAYLEDMTPPIPGHTQAALMEVPTVKAEKKFIGLEAHPPSWRHWQCPEYWMFQAAKDGCLDCVRRCVEEKRLDLHFRSKTMGYTVKDYALFGIAKGFAETRDVLQCLDEKLVSTPSSRTSRCIPFQAHVPKQTNGHLGKLYLFQAAQDGCEHCARQYLTVELIDSRSTSEPEGLTVLDYAEIALDKNTPGANEVVAYLRNAWPNMPAQRLEIQRLS